MRTDSLRPSRQVLAAYPRFLLITSYQPSVWLKKRILADPRYSVSDLGERQYPNLLLHYWQVQRKPGA